MYIQVKLTTKQALPLYQMGDDFRVLGSARSCASGGCPAVMVLQDQPDTIFDKYWQYYVYAINPGMTLAAIIALMGDAKALMNNTGFGDEGNPRANFLTGKNLAEKPPRLDKLRTFALSTHTGTEEGEHLVLRTFDGNQPPPMKPGRPKPERLADVRLDDYLYNPYEHRCLFMDCTNVRWQPNRFLAYGPFDHGSVRPEIPDGKMHSFFPLVSKFRILSPLRCWVKVPAGFPFPSPFRQ